MYDSNYIDPPEISYTGNQNLPRRQGGEVTYLEPIEAGQSGTNRTLADLLRLFWDRKYVVFAVVLLGLFLGWLSTVAVTPYYRSRAAIEILSMSQSEALYGIIERDWTGGGGGASSMAPEAYLQTQLQILQNHMFARRVFERLESVPRAGGFKSDRSPLRRSFAWLLPLPESDAGALPPVTTDFSVLDNTRIVNIVCESPDPGFAAEVANTTAQEFIAYNRENQTKTAEETKEWLSGQLVDMRAKVEDTENRLRQYSDQVGLLFEAEQPESEKQKLEQLQHELAAARSFLIEKQSVYEVAVEMLPTEAGLSEPQFATLRSELGRRHVELEHLLRDFTPDHPQVIAVKNEIEQLEERLKQEVNSFLLYAKKEYETARVRLDYISDAYFAQLGTVSTTASKAQRYEELQNELKRNQGIYENLLEKATVLTISTAMRSSSQIRTVEPAVAPNSPYSPRLVMNLLFGLISGIIAGFGLVWLHSGDHVHRPGELEGLLRLPELGAVPSTRSDLVETGRSKAFSVARMRQLMPSKGSKETRSTVGNLVGIGHSNGDRLVSEAFHGVVASLVSFLPRVYPVDSERDKKARTIAMVSAFSGEGKTTVARNLSVALAQVGLRVLLVDADLRAPSVHHAFGLPLSDGLSSLITKNGDTAWRTLVRGTEFSNLTVLDAGKTPKDMPAALHSRNLRVLIEGLREEFDFVLIDTPPILEFSDARIIAKHVDFSIMVVRAGQTARHAARYACNRLQEDGLPILGTILNGWNPRTRPSYHYNR